MKIFNKFYKVIKGLTISVSLVFVSSASLVYLYNQRGLIITYLYPDYRKNNNIDITEKDIAFAKKIMEGGFILHFRHTERDKWIDVAMYDSLESDLHENGVNDSRYAEEDYFKDAVCLNSRGIVQAKAIGEHIKNIKLPIGYIISSPSCRARQTAQIVFGRYDKLNRDLVHVGPYAENKSERINKLKDLYNNIPINKGQNTIVSAHNGVINYQMFENSKDPNLSLEEGGFFIISRKKNKLYLEHEFHNLNDFIRLFYKR